MNAILPEASILSVVKIESTGSTTLKKFRHDLGESPHQANDVGKVGREWLIEVLDANALNYIYNFVNSSSKALLVRGISLNTNVATPRTGFLSDDLCVLDFDLLHFGMLSLLGIKPHSVDYENNGKLVRNVVPVEEALMTTSSWGADVDFSWHTDNPNWPFISSTGDVSNCVPRFLAFMSVKNGERASTDITCVDCLLRKLPKWAISELQKPSYTFGAPVSNEGISGEKKILPLVEKFEQGYYLRFDEGIVEAIHRDGKRALNALRECLNKTDGISIILNPGDFFIFKNTQVLHRRKAFKPLANGEARWLRRVYGS
ncbi:TauD/TfdA family dioxygenase [Halomonas sp. ISL-60]|uniref:TauD/TfdA family dioxygenase n=1 Tax=Halomonas sp. ISL-56 TaxID=2819149 RepID=UPI001BE691F5|nr:TauD/TfdA family dioxygenase [Halomonas sp. ISL-56]MBT2772734.1 TauD/TfdA family dioxygenase [Halomonas sp. ISL-60]MBT2800529.1 TauD/TfdA family dioxygenase [Halomonas sp. ISL-56]